MKKSESQIIRILKEVEDGRVYPMPPTTTRRENMVVGIRYQASKRA